MYSASHRGFLTKAKDLYGLQEPRMAHSVRLVPNSDQDGNIPICGYGMRTKISHRVSAHCPLFRVYSYPASGRTWTSLSWSSLDLEDRSTLLVSSHEVIPKHLSREGDTPSRSLPKTRYPKGSRVHDLTSDQTQLFVNVHKNALNPVVFQPPDTFGTTSW